MNYITINPQIRSGQPVITGTGFTIAQVVAEIADTGLADFLRRYDHLEEESVRGALRELAYRIEYGLSWGQARKDT